MHVESFMSGMPGRSGFEGNGFLLRFAQAGFQGFRGLAYQGPTVRMPEIVAPAPGVAASLWSAPDAAARVTGHEVMRSLAAFLPAAGPAGSTAGAGGGAVAALLATMEPPAANASPGPQAAAQQVLDRVGQALQEARRQGADDAALRDLLAQARSGVEQGVADARAVLSGVGVGEGPLMTQVDETEDALQEGLAALEAQLAPPAPAASYTSYSGAWSMEASRSQRLSLQVTTRDGDTVTLLLSSSRGLSQNASLLVTADGATFSVERSVYTSSRFSLSVEGELDAQEVEAIQSLMKRVDKLAERFFEHGMQAAFAKAMAMELDGETLVSFSLDMQMEISRQASLQYQQVAALEPAATVAAGASGAASAVPATQADGTRVEPASGLSSGISPGLSSGLSLAEAVDRLSGLIQDMKAAMELPEMAHGFSHPGEVFRQLFGAATALSPDSNPEADAQAQDDGGTQSTALDATLSASRTLVEEISAALSLRAAQAAGEEPDPAHDSGDEHESEPDAGEGREDDED